MVISEQCSLHEKAAYEMHEKDAKMHMRLFFLLLLPLFLPFMNSDCQSTLDWLADDSEEDICVGTQLSAADYRPHHQSHRAALLRVNRYSSQNPWVCFPLHSSSLTLDS